MRTRYVTFRVSDFEYQALKAVAARDGTSVPVAARRLALDSVQTAARFDAIERLLKGQPDRAMLVEVAQRLGRKIDAGITGATPRPAATGTTSNPTTTQTRT